MSVTVCPELRQQTVGSCDCGGLSKLAVLVRSNCSIFAYLKFDNTFISINIKKIGQSQNFGKDHQS